MNLPPALDAFLASARAAGQPTLMDAYACQGGAGRGYARAGFQVFAVDIGTKRQGRPGYTPGPLRRNPFPHHHGDALEAIAAWGHLFDAIHASPPCQRYTHGNAGKRTNHPDLVGPTREALEAAGRPYIIENVPRAPLVDPITLCGTMFRLQAVDEDGTRVRLQRHRLFESNVHLAVNRPCDHTGTMPWAGAYGGARRDRWEAKHVRKGGYVPSKAVQQALLGIDWMTEAGLHQALPPVYTEHLGHQLLQALEVAA